MSSGSQVTAKAKSKPKRGRKKAAAITEDDVAKGLKIKVPGITYTPIEKQPRVSGDLNWKGERDCAANLSFSTPKKFLDWIKSDQFRPFWESYVQNRNDVPGIKNAKPTKHFELLDNIFKNEAADMLTDDEQCIIQGRPQADWEPYKYALSSIARVYMASRDHLDHEFDAGPFFYDLKFERWYRIWNVFSWCSHDKPFSNLEAIARRRNHFKTLTKPWYITKQALEVNGNGRSQEEDSEDPDIESNYEMLWENAPSKPAHSLRSMTPLASKIPSLPLPPFYFYSPQQNDEQGSSDPSRSFLAEGAAKSSTSRLDSEATLQNEAQELMQYDGRPADDTPKRGRDRSEPTGEEEGLDAKMIKIDRPREESTLQVIDKPQAAPLSSLILSMGGDRSGPRRRSTRISAGPQVPSNSVRTPLWEGIIWRDEHLSDNDEGVDSDIEGEASPIDEEVTDQDEDPVTREDDSDHTLTLAEFSSGSHEAKSSSCLSMAIKK